MKQKPFSRAAYDQGIQAHQRCKSLSHSNSTFKKSEADRALGHRTGSATMPKVGRRPHMRCYGCRHESPPQPRTLRNMGTPRVDPRGRERRPKEDEAGHDSCFLSAPRHGRSARRPPVGDEARPSAKPPHPDSTGGGGGGEGALGARGPPRANRKGRDHRAEPSAR